MGGVPRQIDNEARIVVERILSRLSKIDLNDLKSLYYRKYCGDSGSFGYLIHEITENVLAKIECAEEDKIRNAIMRKIKEDKPTINSLMFSLRYLYNPPEIRETVKHLLDIGAIHYIKGQRLAITK